MQLKIIFVQEDSGLAVGKDHVRKEFYANVSIDFHPNPDPSIAALHDVRHAFPGMQAFHATYVV